MLYIRLFGNVKTKYTHDRTLNMKWLNTNCLNLRILVHDAFSKKVSKTASMEFSHWTFWENDYIKSMAQMHHFHPFNTPFEHVKIVGSSISFREQEQNSFLVFIRMPLFVRVGHSQFNITCWIVDSDGSKAKNIPNHTWNSMGLMLRWCFNISRNLNLVTFSPEKRLIQRDALCFVVNSVAMGYCGFLSSS